MNGPTGTAVINYIINYKEEKRRTEEKREEIKRNVEKIVRE